MKKKKKRTRKKTKKARQPVRFPINILKPIGDFLAREVKRLERRKSRLTDQDPFSDVSRVIDNAASDSDAAEQIGHAQVTAMKKQTDRKLIQIKKALARIKIGKYGICESCGQMVDTDRLMVMPEATICINCERKKQ
ncbi:MAG TPA: TraR/DksA C4-type zinc finger protein [Nevskiaceae bacterium]|nr:TraR/DksA C4-type zinc finger protein [Nevskiaceae bacterium]